MKIRILDDSIRLRLDRSEVAAIAQGDSVDCATHFPGGTTLHYRLRVDEDVSATFSDGAIEVSIPQAAARHWALTDSEVSLQRRLPAGGHELSLLVEKDFECLEPRAGEGQSNRFPNPAR